MFWAVWAAGLWRPASVASFRCRLSRFLGLAGPAFGHGLGMGPFGIVYLPDAKEQDQNKNTQFEPDPHAVPPLPGRPQIDASGLLARMRIVS